MPRRKYISFTNELCQEIVDKYEATLDNKPRQTRIEVALWVKSKYSLHTASHERTIKRIVNSKSDIVTRIEEKGIHSKRQRVLASPGLDENPSIWVWQMYEQGVSVADEMIRSNELVETDDSKVSSLKFSNGWLRSFKKRHNFRCFKSHGESAEIDEEVLEEQLLGIQERLNNYTLNDIWNCDEFGLAYNMPSTSTINRKSTALCVLEI